MSIAGDRGKADGLIRRVDRDAVSELRKNLLGPVNPEIIRSRKPLKAPPPLPKERRVGSRMPSPAEQREIIERDGHACRFCGMPVVEEKVAAFEGLLDPAEKLLDRPAALVEIGDLLGRGIEIVTENTQDLAGLDLDANLANRIAEGILAALSLALRQQPDAVGEDVGVCGTSSSSGAE